MRKSKETQEAFQKINIELERLNVAIITRYPDSTRAAEEYAALRRGVMAMASASTLHRQNLISLINSIDDGATSETVRGKIVDLLSTLNVQEISVDEAHLILKDQLIHCFDEVRDQAHERAAWIQQTANGVEVAQKGYLKSFPPQASVETPSKSGDGKDREDLLMGMEVEVADAESSAVVVDIERGTGATGDIK